MVAKVNRWKNVKKSLTLLWRRHGKKMLLYSEQYLEPVRTSTMELFCENG